MTTGFKVNGQDIDTLYATNAVAVGTNVKSVPTLRTSGTYNTPSVTNTGFKLSNGADIAALFNAPNPGLYQYVRVAGTTGDGFRPDDNSCVPVLVSGVYKWYKTTNCYYPTTNCACDCGDTGGG